MNAADTIREVLILAGGRGTRLREAVPDRPKVLADVNGTPFLELIIRRLAAASLTNICLLTGYRHEQVSDHFGDGARLGVSIRYSREEEPLGTGGALGLAIKTSDGIHEGASDGPARYLAMNGDSWYSIDYTTLISAATGICTLALKPMADCDRYGTVTVASDGRITGYGEKTKAGPGLINSGFYVVESSLTRYIADGVVSLENDVFPRLVADDQLRSVTMDAEFIDIGIPADYQRFVADIAQNGIAAAPPQSKT